MAGLINLSAYSGNTIFFPLGHLGPGVNGVLSRCHGTWMTRWKERMWMDRVCLGGWVGGVGNLLRWK